jgi:hypothetical protein
MKLPEYLSFDEKAKHFNLHYIDTIEGVKQLLAEHINQKGIYRGINNSGYKIYTSLQRQIICNGLTNFNIEKYISETRNELILKKYFRTFNIVPSKLSIWSYLQHYKAPTPLIDFTFDIKNAFYFATENFNLEDFKETKKPNDRFSIFFIENSNLELLEINKVLEGFKKYRDYCEEIFYSYPPEKDFNYDSLMDHFDRMFDINILTTFLLHHKDEFIEVFNAYNNIRIIAQNGLFINNSSKTLPLEEELKFFFIEATRFQHSPWDEIDTLEAHKMKEDYKQTLIKNQGFQKRLEKNIIHSFEIKKELIPEIQYILDIKKKDIYPNEEEIAWKIFERANE